MSTWKELLFSDPFKVEGDIIDESAQSKEALVAKGDNFEQPAATKGELWGYYLYYNGDNGFTMNSYMPNILQSLAYKGGFYLDTPDVQGCDPSNTDKVCYVPWSGGPIPVASMSLYIQAIAFSIQFVLFTTFGSLGDYGRWNRWILLGATIIGCFTQIIPIVFVNNDGSQWNGMMGIMCIAWISYGASLVFYAAAFPLLADNLPVVRQARFDPNVSREEYVLVAEKWRNNVSAISTTFSNVGFLIVTAVLSGASFAPWENYAFDADTPHVLGNVPLFNYISTVVCGGFWVINAIPYFLWVPARRGGPPLPPNEHYMTIGWKNIFGALREARKLRYLFMYIIAYFLFSDAVNTLNSMIGITQGQITSFNAQQVTILNLVSAICSIIGCMAFLWIQRYFKIRTKTNLLIIIGLTAVVPIWGSIGIGTTHFGIHNTWELWVFYVWSGLFTAPIWAWQQTMLAELVPKGRENLFFGLFGVVNKASSWIGPVVIGAITATTSNLWNGWPFVLALFIISVVIIWFIDVDQAKEDIRLYLEENVLPTDQGIELSHAKSIAEPVTEVNRAPSYEDEKRA
ncbi:autophagy-related protein 22-like protein [Umbelopsis sp. AD052]|nr:autophagy-related protein 22-like protein [Umbelopsis sp. AD052]